VGGGRINGTGTRLEKKKKSGRGEGGQLTRLINSPDLGPYVRAETWGALRLQTETRWKVKGVTTADKTVFRRSTVKNRTSRGGRILAYGEKRDKEGEEGAHTNTKVVVSTNGRVGESV